MNLRTWLWLLAAQSVWAGSYLAMKFAGDELPVGVVVTLRYGLASLGFLALILPRGLPQFDRRDWLLIGALGVLNFTVSPVLQVTALRHTQSIDVAILVALEPVLTVLMAALFLREGLTLRTVVAGALGVAGALILSGVGLGPGGGFTAERLWGNGLFLLSILCEVSVTVAGGRIARRYDPLVAMAALKTVGFLASAIVFAGVWGRVEFVDVTARAWISIIYLAWDASLFSYAVWYWAIRQAPVRKVALSLFVQPVIGALLGYLLAGEIIGWNTALGALLIAAAFAVEQSVSAPGKFLPSGS